MDVGFYNRANQFSGFPSTNLVGIITRVIYSVQCELQDDTVGGVIGPLDSIPLDRQMASIGRIVVYIMYSVYVVSGHGD